MARVLFWLLDVPLLVLALLTLATPYLHPERFLYTEFLAVGRPYLLLLLLVAGLVAAALHRAGIAGLHLALVAAFLVLSGWPSVLRWAFAPDAVAGEKALTLMTYNVPSWHRPMEELTPGMAELVGAADPDVLCLQEAHVSFYPPPRGVEAKPYVAVLADSLGYRIAVPEASGPTYTPQPLLARQAPLAQIQEWVGDRYGPRSGTPVTRTELTWQGRRLAVYNVHLVSFGSPKPWNEPARALLGRRAWRRYAWRYRHAFAQRAREAEELRAMLDEETLPHIVCGDLNSAPGSWVYRHVRGELRDAYREAGTGWGMTYHSDLPFARIDYVFVSEAFEVHAARVVDTQVSDHRPLVVRLSWRDER